MTLAPIPAVRTGNYDTSIPGSTYTVQRDEKLPEIAHKLGVSAADLLAANPQIANPAALYPDQVLHVPDGGDGGRAEAQGVRAEPDPGSGGLGPGPADPDPTRQRLRELIDSFPQRGDFPGGWIGDAAYAAARSAHAAELVAVFKQDAAATSPTSAKIFAEAERLGIPVTVLSNEEYDKRFPGTAGVTNGDGVFVPVRSLESGSVVLEHELWHAILGKNDAIFNPLFPMDMRLAQARALFERMGFDPDDGERLVRATDGWSGGVDRDHLQAYVNGIDIARERAGLPPLSPTQRDELYAEAAKREAALGVRRGPLEGIDEKSPLEQLLALAAAEEQWAQTPQGQANPPSGDTFEERLASLRAILDRFANEDRFSEFKP